MFGWFRKPKQEKESRTGGAIFTGRNYAHWTPRSYDKFAEEGYQKNVIAYQAINKVATAVASVPWYAKRPNGDELTENPFLNLLENPNPLQSRSEFLRALVGFYMIAGNGYIERVSVRGQARELYALRPDRMIIKPGQAGFPSGYEYRVGQNKVMWDVEPRTGESDIRHIKTFNPLDDWYGMSPIEAGAYAIDQHNESMSWMQSLLQNGAAPSGAMEMGSDKDLTDDQFNRLKAEIDEKYTGSRNAGRPMLLEGGLKWTQMGLSPVDVAIIETKYSAARDVSLAFGVPPLLLNIPGDSTFNNYKEARLAFWEETVIPLLCTIRDELNSWLSDSFGGVLLEVDLDQVPAIAEKRSELWTMADASTDLTINERRAMKGYDEIEGGDAVLVQSSMIPLDMATEPLDFGDGLDVEAGKLSADELKALAYGER
jgi:HK97 family phage portal protein